MAAAIMGAGGAIVALSIVRTPSAIRVDWSSHPAGTEDRFSRLYATLPTDQQESVRAFAKDPDLLLFYVTFAHTLNKLVGTGEAGPSLEIDELQPFIDELRAYKPFHAGVGDEGRTPGTDYRAQCALQLLAYAWLHEPRARNRREEFFSLAKSVAVTHDPLVRAHAASLVWFLNSYPAPGAWSEEADSLYRQLTSNELVAQLTERLNESTGAYKESIPR